MDDDRYTRITLRIPKDLHAMLQEAADTSSKSVNAEIIERVRQSFGASIEAEKRFRQITARIDALEAAQSIKRREK